MNISLWDKHSDPAAGLDINLCVGKYKFTFDFGIIKAQTIIDNVLPTVPQMLFTQGGKQFTITNYSVDADNENILYVTIDLHENVVGCIAICIAIGAVLVVGIVFLTKVERIITLAPLLLPVIGYVGYKAL